MRSSMVAPAGSVWSKKCASTMCEAWRSAARRRRGFSPSGGSRWRARSALCRHSTAARTASRLAPLGSTWVLAQPCAWAPAGAARAARVSATARRRALRTVTDGNTADDLRGTSVDRCDGPSDPAVNSVLRQPGWLIDVSPVALRPVLADGLPFREANLRCLSGYVPRGLSGCDNGRPVLGCRPHRRWDIGVAGFEPAKPPQPKCGALTRLSYTPMRVRV